MRTYPLALFACLLGGGCGQSGPGNQEFDPEYFSLTEMVQGREEPDWSQIEPEGTNGFGYPDVPVINLHQEFRVGAISDRGDILLFGIVPMELDGAGNIYAKLRDGEIVVLSPDGEYLRSVGRVGEGPGEFASVSQISFLGDTLVVSDLSNGRVTLFDSTGQVLETIPIGPSEILAQMVHGGGIFMQRFVPTWPRRNTIMQGFTRIFWRSEVGRVRSGPDFAAKVIADVPTDPVFCGSSGGCSTIAWGVHGEQEFDGSGNVYVHAGLPPYRIDVYDWEGNPVRRIERPHTPVLIGRELFERFQSEAASYVDSLRASKPVYGEVLAALGEMAVSEQGAILVNRPDLVEDPVRPDCFRAPSRWWDLFDPSGGFVGTVELPRCMWPVALSEDGIVGVERDELGVEYISKFSWEALEP